jgi:hypothetical protein
MFNSGHVKECERYLDERAACSCPIPESEAGEIAKNEQELERMRLELKSKAIDSFNAALGIASMFLGKKS